MRKLWFQIFHTSSATGVGVLTSVVAVMITARVLGPDGRGLFAAANSWIGLVATLGSLSLGQVLLHHVAGRPSEEWLPETLGTALLITVTAALVGWLCVTVLYLVTHGGMFNHLSPSLLVISFVALPFVIWIDTGRYLLVALDILPKANWAQMAGAVTSLAGMVAFVVIVRLGVIGALMATGLSSIVVGTAMFVLVARRAPKLRVSTVLLKKLLRGSTQLHLNAIGTYLFTQASVLVLNYYRPPSDTAYYQLAMQLLSLSLIVSSAMGAVAFGLVAQRGPNDAWPMQRRLMFQAFGVVTVLTVIAYAAAPLAIRLVAGERFLPAVPLFRTVLPALLGATFSTIMASQWIGRGLFREAAGFTLVVGILSISLDLSLVPRYGVRGALVSTLATYGISVVGNGYMALWVERRWRAAQVIA